MNAPDRTTEQAEMLANRIRKNHRRLRKYLAKAGVTCFRVYDADIPEVPLAVDVYEDRLHLAEYARRGSPEGPDHEPWLQALAEGAAAALDIAPQDVFIKRRERQRGTAQYTPVARERARFEVREGGLRFIVNLSDYLDTGLFLDHRQTRDMVRAQADGARFLNLFAYTGAFTVYAAAGGAVRTTTVDLSRTYLDQAHENLRLNGFTGSEHRLVRADVMDFLAEDTERYDLMVIDPPTFSNSKRMQGVFDVQRDHVELLERAFERLVPGGTLYFSTNFRRFSLDPALAGRLTEISGQTVPPDFRNRRIHRCWRGGA